MNLIPVEQIAHYIYFIRDQRVMLDRDLARLYRVETFNLNKAVRRNHARFPADFMFQLTRDEYAALRFQTGMLKRGQHAKYLPYAFTQEGISMLSGVLHSPRAVEVNIAIMRAFVRMGRLLSENKELARKLDELENKLIRHDYQIGHILQAIRRLMQGPRKPSPKIGYLA
jgi:hypothetical protein